MLLELNSLIFMDVNPWVRKRKMCPYFLMQKSVTLVSWSHFDLRHILTKRNPCVFSFGAFCVASRSA